MWASAGRAPAAGAAGEGRSGSLSGAAVDAVAAWLEDERSRWFYWFPVFLGLGIAAYFWLPEEPRLAAALAPFPIVLALRAVAGRGTFASVLVAALIAAAMGVALAKLRAEWVRAPVLQKPIGPTELRGFVELIEPRPTRGQRLTLRVTALGDLAPSDRPTHVRVRTLSTPPGLAPGDAVKLRVRLAPPAGPALPGGYDFARSAWFQGLGGIGYAVSRPAVDKEAGEPPSALVIRAMIERARKAIGDRVVAALPGETGAIANALITGERGGISEATNDAFRDSGLLHILSISGLHMVIMAGAVFWVVRLGLAAIPALALRYPIKKWAAVAAALGALGYLLISGSSFPTVRSYIMISFMFLAVLFDRPGIALRNVALAALLILFLWPESLLDPGFQMSFAAVVALVSGYEAIRARSETGNEPLFRGALRPAAMFFGGIVLSTLIASLAVAPLAAYHFHKSQQFAIIANLLAIPVCNVVVMPAALATLVAMPFGLEPLSLAVMGWGIDGMVACAYWVASLPGAVGRIPAMPGIAFALMVGGGLWLLLWHRRPRVLGLASIALGVGLAPTLALPDLYVGRDGALIAVRSEDGHLSALPAPQSSFELARWLEHDGDGRSPREAAKAQAFRCDAAGCTAEIKGVTLAVARHPAALADDCRRGVILVLSTPRPTGCAGPVAVTDLFAVRDEGTHALFVEGPGKVRVETVAAWRGNRPWSPVRVRPAAGPRSAGPWLGARERSRIGAFAAPDLVPARERARPEIEDEEEDAPAFEVAPDDEEPGPQ